MQDQSSCLCKVPGDDDDDDIEGPTRSQRSCLWDREQVSRVWAADETEYMCISVAKVVHMHNSIFTPRTAKTG